MVALAGTRAAWRTEATAPNAAALALAAAFLSGRSLDATHLPWYGLREGHARALRAWAMTCLSRPAARAVLESVRATLDREREAGRIVPEDHARATRPLRPPTGSGPKRRIGLPARALAALLAACLADTSPRGARDAAIVGVIAGCGLTAGEAARQEWRHYDRERDLLLVRGGGAGRAVILDGSPVATVLDRWAAVSWPGAAFVFTHLEGSRAGRPLSRPALYSIVRRRALDAGLGRLVPADLGREFWRGLARQHAAGQTPCSLLVLEDETAWVAMPALQLPLDGPAGTV